MWRTTWKGIMARKLRLLLTALAIVLGVSFVVGSFVLTDTLSTVFTRLLDQGNAGVDIAVQTHSDLSGSTATRRPVPGAVLDQIERTPGVGAVDGRVVDRNTLLYDKDGKPIRASQTLGFSMGPIDVLNIVTLREGKKPSGPKQVAIDQLTADRYHFAVGDTIQLNGSSGEAERFRISGIIGFGDEPGFPASTVAAFDTETAQRIFKTGDSYTLITVKVEPGADIARVRHAIAQQLPPGVEALTQADFNRQNSQQFQEGFADLNRLLLLFSAIGIIAGFVMIFNTFSILVTQRLRELGLIRALGGSGTQVTWAVLAESTVVGVVGAALGIVGGFALAVGAWWGISTYGPESLHLPNPEYVVTSRTLVIGIAVGLIATVIASLIPARRAARIPPVAAMSETNPLVKPLHVGRRAAFGAVVALVGVGIGLAVLSSDLAVRNIEQGIATALTGVVLFGVGVAIAAPVVARPFSILIGNRWMGLVLWFLGAVTLVGGAILVSTIDAGWRIAVGIIAVVAACALWFGGRSLRGVSGRIARRNASRNPRRTALTAIALMIGVALVVVVSTLAISTKATLQKALSSGLNAELVLTPADFGGFATFPSEASALVAKQPGVEAVGSLRGAMARYDGGDIQVVGVDPDVIEKVANFNFSKGDIAGLREGGIVMYADAANGRGLHVGDQVPITFSSTGTVSLPLVGIFTQPLYGPFGPIDVAMSIPNYVGNFGYPTDSMAWVRLEPGVDPAVAQQQLTKALSEKYPSAVVENRIEFQHQQEKQLDQILVGFYALMAVAIVIALLGIVNTIFLSVYERTRELGLMRAVGMLRSQVRSMIRGEAVIIAVIGALLGIIVGGFGAWTLIRSLKSKGLTEFVIPYQQLVVFIVVAAVAGVATAILPAWRAARLNVLDAISVEFFSTGDHRERRARRKKAANPPLLRSSAPRAISSEVEHFLDTEGVRGSSPLSPTSVA